MRHWEKENSRAINDPLDQTHIHNSTDHYSRFILFCDILKSGDGRTYRQHMQK